MSPLDMPLGLAGVCAGVGFFVGFLVVALVLEVRGRRR